MEQLKVADVVQLKSSSIRMVVEKVRKNGTVCLVYWDGHELRRGKLHCSLLEKV